MMSGRVKRRVDVEGSGAGGGGQHMHTGLNTGSALMVFGERDGQVNRDVTSLSGQEPPRLLMKR